MVVVEVKQKSYESMTGREFLRQCKDRGVKPCCRGRKKAVVIAELEALDKIIPCGIKDEPDLKLACPRFSAQRRGPQVVIQDHIERWLVCRFDQRGMRFAPGPIMDKYAEICCKALNDHDFGG